MLFGGQLLRPDECQIMSNASGRDAFGIKDGYCNALNSPVEQIYSLNEWSVQQFRRSDAKSVSNLRKQWQMPFFRDRYCYVQPLVCFPLNEQSLNQQQCKTPALYGALIKFATRSITLQPIYSCEGLNPTFMRGLNKIPNENRLEECDVVLGELMVDKTTSVHSITGFNPS